MADLRASITSVLSTGRGRTLAAAAALAIVLLAVLAAFLLHDQGLRARLLTTEPNEIPRDAALVRYAASLAKPAYAKHCASCHGAQMQGDTSKGAPNLRDDIPLYDFGRVSDIERTVLYGIRSGQAKARNITDMPALGRTMQLSDAEVADVTTYVLSLTRAERDTAAVARGAVIFQNKGVCYDCHSGDAKGNPDYGAPDLTDNDWLYGGDRASVRHSIFEGRHGLCPAWKDRLKPAVIRALAVYIHSVSAKAAPQEAPKAHG